MLKFIARYVSWLHLQWPAGKIEKLPVVRDDGTTNVPGLFVVGDLTGIPLLKFAAASGALAVQHMLEDPGFVKSRRRSKDQGLLDLVIVGAGISGMAAALEARKAGLDFVLLEASEPFSTIRNFPKGKPIYTYPTEMIPAGELQFHASVKEPLVADLVQQTLGAGVKPRQAMAEKVVRRGRVLEVVIRNEDPLLARRVIVGIGRSGSFRKLLIPGEQREGRVFNRLHDPKDFCGKQVLVVGGGDSALEAAIALAQSGGQVTISYRRPEFSRPKPENLEKLERLRQDPGAAVDISLPTSERVTTASGPWIGPCGVAGHVELCLGSKLKEIGEQTVTLVDQDGQEQVIENDAVFAMIGREAPLDFFRRSGVQLHGESTPLGWVGITLFFLVVGAFYNWKSGGVLATWLSLDGIPAALSSLGSWWADQVADRATLLGTLAISMREPSFWFTLLYTLAIGIFGIRRIRRRKTPYVTLQTSVLFLVQFLPLFLLPELILPLLGYNGFFTHGLGASLGDQLFPLYVSSDAVWPAWGHPRAYWRAYGLILAWPLNLYDVMTDKPLVTWLVISGVQTFVLIPLLVWRFGKGAYCGWICSCGALAETLGDGLRKKMPHGPRWNRLNLLGQVILLLAALLALMRVLGWFLPGSFFDRVVPSLLQGGALSYKWVVDVGIAGILGTGLYVKFSGRVWCRFACPLAALMNIYARFSRFRILAEKKKCISCNVCTSVCHMGIDIMNFANKGLPMQDPQCVRCSACVQSCPTGVLSFGEVKAATGEVVRRERLGASPVRMREAAGALATGARALPDGPQSL